MFLTFAIPGILAIVVEIAIYVVVAALPLRRALIVYLWNLISSGLAGVINMISMFITMAVARQAAMVVSLCVLVFARFFISRIILAKKANLAGTRLQLTAALISTLPLAVGFGGMLMLMQGIR